MNFDPKKVPASAIYTITEECNLACKYCYTRFEQYKPKKASSDVARALVDFLAAQYEVRSTLPPQGRVEPGIHFFGGEPLVAWDVLQDCVMYAETVLPRKWKWSMTTNATLITKEKADYLKSHNFSLLLSLDGPEDVTNLYRVFHDGSGAFSAVLSGFRNLGDLSRYECRGTLGPDNIPRLLECYQFLYSLGLGAATVLPSYEHEWTADHLEAYENACTEVAAWWIHSFRGGRVVNVKQIDDGLRYLLAPPCERMPCGRGDRCLAVCADGTFFPCHRLTTRQHVPDEWRLGNVFDGIDEDKFVDSIAWDPSRVYSQAGYDCSLCPVRPGCTGFCLAVNIDVPCVAPATRTMNSVDPDLRYGVAKAICDTELIHFKTAALVYGILRTDPKFQAHCNRFAPPKPC